MSTDHHLEDLIAEAEIYDLVDAGPTVLDLAYAPTLDRWVAMQDRVGHIMLFGHVTGHPRLGDRDIHTSQAYGLDAEAGWARTRSRWYVLGRPFAELETALAESMGVGKPKEDFLRFALPGYVPLKQSAELNALLSEYIAWVRAFDQQDRGVRG